MFIHVIKFFLVNKIDKLTELVTSDHLFKFITQVRVVIGKHFYIENLITHLKVPIQIL